MKIFGFNYDLFISSICYLEGGKLQFATPEERLIRYKNTRDFPNKSLSYILDKYKINLDNIDYFVSSFNPGVFFNKFNPLMSSRRRHFSEHLISFPDQILRSTKNDRDKLDAKYIKQNIQFLGKKLDTYFINHHDAHIANSFYQSKFKKALGVVIDLQGEIASTSIYICEDNKFNLIEKIDYPNSIGMLYATITEYLGFKANSDEWKVMAISNLSNDSKKYYDIFRKNIVNYNNNGDYDINLKYFNSYYPLKPRLYSNHLIDILGNRNNNSHNPTKKQKDVANALQKITTEIIHNKINFFINKTGIKNICCSGGVFMNCLMNGYLERKFNDCKIYIPYAPDDSGNSIGAALYLKKNILKKKFQVQNINNPYLGKSFEDLEILKILKKYKINFTKVSKVEEKVAKLLNDGNIIGWFQGRSEFGQRSLGNRSILASPKVKNIKFVLNSAIKYRESFRPFAPAVLEEKFNYYFQSKKIRKIPFMEKIYYLRSKFRNSLSSICHADGSARAQTVGKKNNSMFYKLIKEFEKYSEVPILINTSFNIKGDPIVDNPDDAIITFYKSGLDVLVLGNFIIKKK